MNLSNEVKLVRCAAGNSTASTTNANGSDVDVSGYEGVVFFAWMEKATATTNTNQLKVEVKDADGNYTALEGAAAVCDTDSQVLAVDVYRPWQKLGKVLRAVVDINTSTKYGDVYAILYNGHIKPEEFADVVTLVASPDVVAG